MTDLHPEIARQALRALPAPLALLNDASVVTWVNAAFAALAGRAPGDCTGCVLEDLDLPLRLTLGAEVRPVAGGSVMLFGLGDTVLTAAAGPGVLTREAALARLEAEISRSRRYENPLSCIAAQFAPGTASGAYVELETMLREQLRWVDVLARWSDAELLVLLPETHGRGASVLCRRLALQAAQRLPEVSVAWGASSWRRGDDARLFVTRALTSNRPTAFRLSGRR
jgi:hypothetical protein